uniref:Reverse transcriptase domain-containing protein n=1 Tax=Anguilla anguilla TaxID=7936 RepID=A0A0E9VR75_ANGAN
MMDQDKTVLDKQLSVEEMLEAVRSMRSGKTPGPNGIPIEIHKLFPDKLLPLY